MQTILIPLDGGPTCWFQISAREVLASQFPTAKLRCLVDATRHLSLRKGVVFCSHYIVEDTDCALATLIEIP